MFDIDYKFKTIHLAFKNNAETSITIVLTTFSYTIRKPNQLKCL